MVGHLARLKLLLLRAGLRKAGVLGGLGFALAVAIGALAGFAGGVLFGFAGQVPDRWVADVVAAGCAGVLLVWVVGPLFVGSEGSLEVDRLVLLPLERRRLLPGLLVAALIGPGGLATALTMTGAVIGLAPRAPAAVITVTAASIFTLLCAAAGRLVAAGVSVAVRSRRWRDVVLIAVPAIPILANLALQAASASALDGGAGRGLAPWAGVLLRVLPSGMPALAMADAHVGRYGQAALELLGAAVWLAAFVLLWGRAVDRLLTTAPSGPGPGRSARAGLFPPWVSFLPRTRTGAVAAKELRMFARDPRQRAQLTALIVPAVLPLAGGVGDDTRVLFLIALPAFFLGAAASNQLGFDGAAYWMHLAAGDDVAADLRGKNLARGILAVAVTVPFSVLAVVLGEGNRLGQGLAIAVVVFGASIAVGNLTSVMTPVAMPDNATNVLSSGGSGRGLRAAVPAFAAMAAEVVLAGPFVGVLLLAEHPLVLSVTAVAAVLTGLGVWWAGLRLATRWATSRQPELLEAVTPARA